MRSILIILLVVVILFVPFLATSSISAAVFSIRGELPPDWHDELLSNRKNAICYQVAHGIQENVYEIRFKDREKFERAWPHFLELKDKGAPITLESGKSYHNRSGSTLHGPGVRVLTPCGPGSVSFQGRSHVKLGPPWPDYIKTAEGVLPEYLTLTDEPRVDGETWVKWQPDSNWSQGLAHRARVDITLVVDGDIVDLNRIKLPADTPIIDKRVLADTIESRVSEQDSTESATQGSTHPLRGSLERR